jgi:hypothetical protein
VAHPAVKLSALRRIGWINWDPIGLADMVGPEFNDGPADEYGSYLMVAFGMAQSGRSQNEIADYLGEIASVYMGLGSSLDGGQAEQETAVQLLALSEHLT